MHVPSMYQVYTTAGESQNMFCAKTLNCTYIMSECIYTLYTRIHCTHVHTHTRTHTHHTHAHAHTHTRTHAHTHTAHTHTGTHTTHTHTRHTHTTHTRHTHTQQRATCLVAVVRGGAANPNTPQPSVCGRRARGRPGCSTQPRVSRGFIARAPPAT